MHVIGDTFSYAYFMYTYIRPEIGLFSSIVLYKKNFHKRTYNYFCWKSTAKNIYHAFLVFIKANVDAFNEKIQELNKSIVYTKTFELKWIFICPAAPPWEARWTRCVWPKQSASTAPLRQVQVAGVLLSENGLTYQKTKGILNSCVEKIRVWISKQFWTISIQKKCLVCEGLFLIFRALPKQMVLHVYNIMW